MKAKYLLIVLSIPLLLMFQNCGKGTFVSEPATTTLSKEEPKKRQPILDTLPTDRVPASDPNPEPPDEDQPISQAPGGEAPVPEPISQAPGSQPPVPKPISNCQTNPQAPDCSPISNPENEALLSPISSFFGPLRTASLPLCQGIKDNLLSPSADKPRFLTFLDFEELSDPQELVQRWAWHDYYFNCLPSKKPQIVNSASMTERNKEIVPDFLKLSTQFKRSGNQSMQFTIDSTKKYDIFVTSDGKPQSGNIFKARSDLSTNDPVRTIVQGDEVWGHFSLYYPSNYPFLTYNHFLERADDIFSIRENAMGVNLVEFETYEFFSTDDDKQRLLPNKKICGFGGGPIGIHEADQRLFLHLRHTSGSNCENKKSTKLIFSVSNINEVPENLRQHFVKTKISANSAGYTYHHILQRNIWYDIVFHTKHCAALSAAQCTPQSKVWLRIGDKSNPFINVVSTVARWGDDGLTPNITKNHSSRDHHRYVFDIAYYAPFELAKFKRCNEKGYPIAASEAKLKELLTTPYPEESINSNRCYRRYTQAQLQSFENGEAPLKGQVFNLQTGNLKTEAKTMFKPYEGRISIFVDNVKVLKFKASVGAGEQIQFEKSMLHFISNSNRSNAER